MCRLATEGEYADRLKRIMTKMDGHPASRNDPG